MKIKLNKTIIIFFVAVTLLFAATSASAQKDSTPKKRLKSPATVKGYIGGEAHDSYVIRARQGQTLTVRITWKNKDNNHAEFSISKSTNFFNSENVKFGTQSNKGKSWRGKIPKTGNYYIYIVAHPSANYTLKVKLQ